MQAAKKSFAILVPCLFLSCSHGPVSNKNSVKLSSKAEAVKRSLASVPAEAIITPEDRATLTAMINQNDVQSLGQTFFVPLRSSQIAYVSVDLQIRSAIKPTDLEALFASKLYCRLQEGRATYENLRQRFVIVATEAFAENKMNWLIQNMLTFANQDVAAKAAMAHLLRFTASQELQVCGSKGCFATQAKSFPGWGFNLKSNAAMKSFMKKNGPAIAALDTVSDHSADMTASTAASCYIDPRSIKAAPSVEQQFGYDWLHRDWQGSNLPQGQFIFTYDDGPHPQFTQQLMQMWQDAGFVKPGFFWLTDSMKAHPDIVTYAIQNQYHVGSHTRRHGNLGNVASAASIHDFDSVNRQLFTQDIQPGFEDGEGFENWKQAELSIEIDDSYQALQDIGQKINPNFKVHYFRLPYGSGVNNYLIGGHLQYLQVDHFFWKIDSLDWQDSNPESIKDRVISQMKTFGNGIVLMHDIHPQSVKATALIIQELKNHPEWSVVDLTKLVPDPQ